MRGTFPFPGVCVCVMFCQGLLSLVLSTRMCCGKRTCMFKGEKLGQDESKRGTYSLLWGRDKGRERECRLHISYTFLGPVTFRIIIEVLLDHHTCYPAPLSYCFMLWLLVWFLIALSHTYVTWRHIRRQRWITVTQLPGHQASGTCSIACVTKVLTWFFLKLSLFWDFPYSGATTTVTDC